MDFKLPYLQAMRQQAPQMFNSLSRTGQLETHAQQKAEEAAQMFSELTANAPKDQTGYPKEPFAREAEDLVKAALIEFPSNLRTMAVQDETNSLHPPSAP